MWTTDIMIVMNLLSSSFHWLAIAVLANSTVIVFAILPMNLLSGLIIPYTRAILSNSVEAKQQAQMFAGLSGIESIGTLLSPLFSLGYSLTVGSFSEAMMVVMSILTAGAAMIMIYVRRRFMLESGSTAERGDEAKEQLLNVTSDCDTTSNSRGLSNNGITSNCWSDRQLSLTLTF